MEATPLTFASPKAAPQFTQWVNCGSQTLPHSGQIFCFTSLTSKLSLPQLIQNLLSDAFGSPQTLHIFIFLSKRQTDFEI
jgi:hypothetical protein